MINIADNSSKNNNRSIFQHFFQRCIPKKMQCGENRPIITTVEMGSYFMKNLVFSFYIAIHRCRCCIPMGDFGSDPKISDEMR